MPGVLRGAELAAAYQRMDCFVFPSLTDTFGLVILEAMASGVPVILSPETGARVGVQDGVSGLLSQDFTASLQRLMHDSRSPRHGSRCTQARPHPIAGMLCSNSYMRPTPKVWRSLQTAHRSSCTRKP